MVPALSIGSSLFPPDYRVVGGAGELGDGREETALVALDAREESALGGDGGLGGGEERLLRGGGGVFFSQESLAFIAEIELQNRKIDSSSMTVFIVKLGEKNVVAVKEGFDCAPIVLVEWIGKENASDYLLRAIIVGAGARSSTRSLRTRSSGQRAKRPMTW